VKVFKKKKKHYKNYKTKNNYKNLQNNLEKPYKNHKKFCKNRKNNKNEESQNLRYPITEKKKYDQKNYKKIVLFGTRKPGFLKPPSFFSKKTSVLLSLLSKVL